MAKRRQINNLTQIRADQEVPVVQTQCYGMIKGVPPSMVPNGYAYKLKNLVARGNYVEGRPGAVQYQPSGDAVIQDAGYTLYSPVVQQKSSGNYFVFLFAVGEVPIQGLFYSSDLVNWSMVLNLESTDPALAYSKILVDGDDIIFVNTNGIWRVAENNSTYYMFIANKNVAVASNRVISDVEESVTKTEGYRYLVTYLALSQSGRVNRLTDSVEILYESSPARLSDGNERDYSERFYTSEIGKDLSVVHSITPLYHNHKGITHYGIYRTKNIGHSSDSYDDETKIGTDPELYVWVDDVPVVNPFNFSVVPGGGGGGDITVLRGSLQLGDLGQNFVMTDAGILIATFDEYTDSTHVHTNNSIIYSSSFTVNVLSDKLTTGGGLLTNSGNPFRVSTDDTLPSPLVADTIYYLKHISGNDYTVHTSLQNMIDNVYVNFTDTGTGTHSISNDEIERTAMVGYFGGTLLRAKQVGTAITYLSYMLSDGSAGYGVPPSNVPDVGDILFWADGGMSIVQSVSETGATALWSEDHVEQAAAVSVSGDTLYRGWNDHVPDDGYDLQVVGLEQRIESGKTYYFPPRFFREIPDGHMGTLGNGYLCVAERDDDTVYYSQVGNKPYWAGIYRDDIQKIECKETIRELLNVNGYILILLHNGIKVLDLTTGINVGNINRGEVVYSLTDPIEKDNSEGCYHWQSIAQVSSGQYLAVTSEGALRDLTINGWGTTDYSVVRGYYAIGKSLQLIDSAYSCLASYTKDGGYKIWIYQSEEENDPPYSVKECYRFARYEHQGVGWSEVYGSYWPEPVYGVGIMYANIDGRKRCFIIDRSNNKLYEDGTFDDSDSDFTYKDKGNDIPTEYHLKGIVASDTDRHLYISQVVSHAFLKSMTHGGSVPTGECLFFLDDDTAVVYGVADGFANDLGENEEITYKARLKSTTLQPVYKTGESNFFHLGMRHEVIVHKDWSKRSERLISEDVYVKAMLDNKLMHLIFKSIGGEIYAINRKGNSTAFSSATSSLIVSPDGNTRGILTTVNTDIGNDAIAGNYVIMFWGKAGSDFTPLPDLTDYGEGPNSWHLYYVDSSDLSANISMIAGSYFDIRIYTGDITNLTDVLAFYFNDIVNNAGRGVLPIYAE